MRDPVDVIAEAIVESQVRNRDTAAFAAGVVLAALRAEYGEDWSARWDEDAEEAVRFNIIPVPSERSDG